MPLLISHGWPGTIVEFLHIIEKLAHPERFGGKEEDAFDVIAPSLPISDSIWPSGIDCLEPIDRKPP